MASLFDVQLSIVLIRGSRLTYSVLIWKGAVCILIRLQLNKTLFCNELVK